MIQHCDKAWDKAALRSKNLVSMYEIDQHRLERY